MKKDGCYLSITGDDVMVNRVVTTRELEEDVMNMPCSSSYENRQQKVLGHDNHNELISMHPLREKSCSPSSSSSIVMKVKDSFRLSTTSLKDDLEERQSILKEKSEETSGSRSLSLSSESRMKIRHMIRDFSTCILLIVSGLIVIFGQEFLTDMSDAILALFAVSLLYFTIFPKIKESGYILLQTLPKHIDVEELKKSFLEEFHDSVLSIHDLHIWCLTSDNIIATCHVSLKASSQRSYSRLSRAMEKFFAKELGLSAIATIQPEFVSEEQEASSKSSSFSCLYKCSKNKDSCKQFKCCNESECDEAAVEEKEENDEEHHHHHHHHRTPNVV